MEHRDLLAGFVRLHMLHHAAEHEVYGRWTIEELARHGDRLSPGTLCLMLETMEERSCLLSRRGRRGRSVRRLYRIIERSREGRATALEPWRERRARRQGVAAASGFTWQSEPASRRQPCRSRGCPETRA